MPTKDLHKAVLPMAVMSVTVISVTVDVVPLAVSVRFPFKSTPIDGTDCIMAEEKLVWQILVEMPGLFERNGKFLLFNVHWRKGYRRSSPGPFFFPLFSF